MFLLDTNVVSELRRLDRADAKVRDWALSQSAALFHISVVTVLEIEHGILLIGRRDQRQADILHRWFKASVLDAFAERIVPIDARVAQRCAVLHVPDPRPERDAMIAATALVHGMTVVTRNEHDFRSVGARVLNPWQGASNDA